MNGTAISLGSTCNRPADEHGAKGKEESHPYSLLICKLKWIMALFALLRKPKGKSSPLKLKKKGGGGISPRPCSVVRAPALGLEGCGFKPQSRHIPRFRFNPWQVQEAANRCLRI